MELNQKPSAAPRPSKVEALAAYFRARPGTWIDACQLARVGGLLSFRTRVSELRRAPFYLQISNRTRVRRAADGSTVVSSEYRLGPPDETR